MIANLEPCRVMRDSGVPWLGEVSQHWQVWRFKYLVKEHDVRSAAGAEQLLDPPKSWVDERYSLGQTLKSGRALENPEGGGIPNLVRRNFTKRYEPTSVLAGEVMNEAGQNVQDLDPATLNKKLGCRPGLTQTWGAPPHGI